MTAIRYPQARSFYPGDCRSQLDTFLAGYEGEIESVSSFCGAVLPHAGWIYSGRVATRTLYHLAQAGAPDTCIVFGTDHYGVKRHCLYPAGEWVTPLGNLMIDQDLVEILTEPEDGRLDCDPQAHEREHSIEVLTPMLKYFWPEAKLTAIIVKHDSSAVDLGAWIGEKLRSLDKQFIFIASSDLTHYGAVYGMEPVGTGSEAFAWMRENDRRMISLLCDLQVKKVLGEAVGSRNACGAGALTALLSVLKTMGVERGLLVEYTTSHGFQSEQHFYTGVGYAGIVF